MEHGKPISRRLVLRAGAGLLSTGALAALMSACGASATPTSAPAPSVAGGTGGGASAAPVVTATQTPHLAARRPLPRARGQPLIAPVVSPRMSWRCPRISSSTVGRIANITPAIVLLKEIVSSFSR